MKSPSAQRHQAIAGLERETTWLLEAAPIRNHLSDISGYLNILSRFIPECKKDEHGRFILPVPPGFGEGEGFESDIDATSNGLNSAKCHHKGALGVSFHGE